MQVGDESKEGRWEIKARECRLEIKWGSAGEMKARECRWEVKARECRWEMKARKCRW